MLGDMLILMEKRDVVLLAFSIFYSNVAAYYLEIVMDTRTT